MGIKRRWRIRSLPVREACAGWQGSCFRNGRDEALSYFGARKPQPAPAGCLHAIRCYAAQSPASEEWQLSDLQRLSLGTRWQGGLRESVRKKGARADWGWRFPPLDLELPE